MFYINTMETTKKIPIEDFQKKKRKKQKNIYHYQKKLAKTKMTAKDEKSDKKVTRQTGHN